MGLTYHFAFKAPESKRPGDLVSFLRSVEEEAKKVGFEPTMVLNAVFDTMERKQFSRRLTTGFPVEDARLKGADLPDDSRVWHLNTAGGTCRVPPSSGVVLVVTNELGQETVMGFFRFPERIEDTKGRVVAETGLGGAWYFRDFVNSPDPRYRALVKRFRDAGYLDSELDEFICETG
jgi:hypothetical protein